jgi:hypothetical protein
MSLVFPFRKESSRKIEKAIYNALLVDISIWKNKIDCIW